jgi:hypothetical protein
MATVRQETASLTLRIPSRLKSDLIAIANREYASVSSVVRRLLRVGATQVNRKQHRRRHSEVRNGAL